MFNHTMAYGPRTGKTFYSVGYEFSKERSNASIGLGFDKIMIGLNMFSPDTWTMNGRPSELYVTANYVYRNKNYRWFMLVGGVGKSIDGNNQIMFRVGADLQISYPLFLTTNIYQTDKTHFMIGGKIIVF